MQNMGFIHGTCKCGGKMNIVKTFANKFMNSARAPPSILSIVAVNRCIIRCSLTGISSTFGTRCPEYAEGYLAEKAKNDA